MKIHPLSDAFEIGFIYVTKGAFAQLDPEAVQEALRRHARCDWGEVCKEDAQANDDALKTGERLVSLYRDSKGVKFWIITEADRSATTILIPDEY